MKNGVSKIIFFLEKRWSLIKGLFVFSVLWFVAFEVGRIFKGISWEQVKINLSSQSFGNIVLMIIAGFVAVLPMLVYDFVIVSFLPGQYSLREILRNGWITNTFTNIAGFGGFLGATLRANFYGKNASKKQVVFALSKIALFLLSGLSLFCIVSLIMIFGFGYDHRFDQYSIWLIGGALYFPGLIIFTRMTDSDFFKDLSWKKELILILGSVFEWGSAAGMFLLIGTLMGVQVNLGEVMVLYFIASIIGVISLVPGGLGSFDVFMLIGLLNLGVVNGEGVAWLLFFRMFYYILPFFVGIFLFVRDAGKRLNQFLDGIPKSIIQKVAHGLLTLFLYVSGGLILLESTVPNFAFGNSVFVKLYPYTFFFLNQLSSVIFAFLLIGVARGIEAKIKKAYWPTICVLLIGIINTLWRSFSLATAIFLIFVTLIVAISRKELYRENLTYSFNRITADVVIFIVVFGLYATVGIMNSPQHLMRHEVPIALLFPSERIWFSGFLGMVIAAIILIIIFRYFTANKSLFSNVTFPEAKIKEVVEKYGGNETSHLAYLKDKQFYFFQKNEENQLFFMYKKKADKIIVMGEPVGNREYLREAVTKLMTDADVQGYQLVFYEIGNELTLLLHDLGFDFLKTGEEGFVELSSFTLAGKKQRAQRALMNKFERENYSFSFEMPPFSKKKLAEFKEISDEWLDGQVEKGFSLGFFDEYYLNQAPIAVIRDSEGNAVAFASMMPTGGKRVLSIDLMRHKKNAPSGIMDKIFISLFEYGREEQYEYFNLGMAPLSNVGRSSYSFIEERAAHLIYEYGYRIYGFQGLRAYKEKYVTDWYPKYTAYRRRSSVMVTMAEVASVVNQPPKGRKSLFARATFFNK
ncbi:bifunctional lysylphosphatidylglycerol flippase/synthetase MprF [Liquorilactobacillus hordei]|uniref:bifunctional lysylphosphatidylglycerol flippase/synthetase MprF n=1 Tax=Liquorilactobacillus hordei TaxID=468911 RepID=UPI001CBBAD07|nr:bifunctional lysylphosphatidylglycerol flippase/synthetase MprF [Liquorilactobacillus hordei]MBZ2405529.1 TIGR00374 family protein [Liquorilactobacillus hordei]